jgi:hypothetical protein
LLGRRQDRLRPHPADPALLDQVLGWSKSATISGGQTYIPVGAGRATEFWLPLPAQDAWAPLDQARPTRPVLLDTPALVLLACDDALPFRAMN